MLRQKYDPTSKRGFSLVELLIALLLGTVLLAMVIGLYVTGVSTGAKSLKYSRLRTDLQSIVAMMETDFRRAGYGGSDYLVGASSNKTIDINASNDCIVYYYNHNDTATVESSNQMAFSFKDNTVKFKSGVGKVANVVCAVTTGWTDVSDNNFIKITALSLTESVTSSASATMRSVKIDLSGELVSDSNYAHSIATRVQVRNLEFN
ncbi:pilus assembly protein PilW [Psychromonas sp. psych-6C06]|uniref:prepilin-type N-terminal cleavage/methylation domain-containing protein n=1 Tax=Psychromonas sp. psych-6C06 TaxID=2058089 RepID=UPI000C3287AB|nr:prepilin-type N-terminal cleavage/methylation domain-containing protein [Psychromonas sp. psych-6C06]PKF62005.1 pilus assembly protein PilW [Psychromonas sp. psych-6C06]